jgi:hypothetical protein
MLFELCQQLASRTLPRGRRSPVRPRPHPRRSRPRSYRIRHWLRSPRMVRQRAAKSSHSVGGSSHVQIVFVLPRYDCSLIAVPASIGKLASGDGRRSDISGGYCRSPCGVVTAFGLGPTLRPDTPTLRPTARLSRDPTASQSSWSQQSRHLMRHVRGCDTVAWHISPAVDRSFANRKTHEPLECRTRQSVSMRVENHQDEGRAR